MKIQPHILSSLALLVGAGCVAFSPLSAQPSVPAAPAPVAVSQLDELLAPIALYPDALVAIILPASTFSSDVVLAARFLNANNSPDLIDSQPWDDSVKAIAHYPDVIKWMDENLAWTQQLGAAYADQPNEVMAAIQRDRQRARASGILVDTPQQQVVVEDGYIRIIPAQPDVIYVPRYEPEIVYVERPAYYYPDPWISFGIGFGVGSWLAYDCDWHTRAIWVDRDRRERWRNHYDWRYPQFPHRVDYASHDSHWQPWRPPAGRPRPIYRPGDFAGRHNWQPSPIQGAPRPSRGDRDRDHDGNRDRDHHRTDNLVNAPAQNQNVRQYPTQAPGRPGVPRNGSPVVAPARPTVITAPANQVQAAPIGSQPLQTADGNARHWQDRRREPGTNNSHGNGQNNQSAPAAPVVTAPARQNIAPTPTAAMPTHQPFRNQPTVITRREPQPGSQSPSPQPIAAVRQPVVAPATQVAPAPRPAVVQAPASRPAWTPPPVARVPAAAPSSVPAPAPNVGARAPVATERGHQPQAQRQERPERKNEP